MYVWPCGISNSDTNESGIFLLPGKRMNNFVVVAGIE